MLEVQCREESGKEQGKAILVVQALQPESDVYLAKMVSIEDDYYAYWMHGGEGHPNPGRYWRRVGKAPKEPKGAYAVPVDRWRVLAKDGKVPNLQEVKWVRGRIHDKVTKEILDAWGPPRHPGKTRAPRSERAQADREDSRQDPRPEGPSAPRLLEVPPRDGADISRDLEAFRRSLEREPGAQRSRPQRERRRKRSGGRTPKVSKKDARSRERVPKRDRVQPEPAQDEQREEGPGEERRRRQDSRSKGRGGPVKRRRSESRERSRSRKRNTRRKERRSESRSRSQSLFRSTSSSAGTATHARLCDYAAKHPGRLAAKLLQRMADRVGRDGEVTAWDRMSMPAVAKSYHLRMLMVTHPTMGLRNSRELHTLSVVLDYLATGQHRKAADVVAQRLKAVEQSVVDSGWERAQFLELLEAPNATMIDKSEEMLLAKEQEIRARIRGKGNPYSNAYWPALDGGGKGAPFGKGKGKSKDKGKKGKDNPKGKANQEG